LVTNSHCYKLNENTESFNKKIWESNEIIGDELKKVDMKNMKDTYSLQNTETVDYKL
jgi:hypothetical protein